MAVLFFLAALLFVPAALSFSIPITKQVPPQCVDPTFACQDIENARLCGVVKSCIHDIWSTMGAPEDNDDICSICKEMVKEARDQLLSNMTQEELKEVFEGSCKLLPVKLIADACIKLVDEFIPELVEMLASRMDPNMVCTVSGLCNVAHLPVHVHLFEKIVSIFKNRDGSDCDSCTRFVGEAKNLLNSMTAVEFQIVTSSLCEAFFLEEKCLEFFNSYSSSLLQNSLKSVDPKTSCRAASICPGKCDEEDNNIKVHDELTCEFCTHVLEHIKGLITANTTVEEFRTALLNFCKHTGSFSDKCTEYVNDYFDQIFAFIRNLDTKGFCTVMGLCSNQLCSQKFTPLMKLVPPTSIHRRFPLMKLLPAIPVSKAFQPQTKNEVQESNDIFAPSSNQLPLQRLDHPSMVFEQNIDCPFCKAISFYVKQDLKGDQSKKNVDKALNNVCSKWVAEFPENCKAFISKYSLHMKHRIVEGADFDDLCFFVKACPLEENNKDLKVKVVKPESSSNVICELCKETFDQIENQLKDPATKKYVEKLLDEVCSYLPSALRDDCSSFIDQNLDTVFNILEEELQSDNVCPALRLCPNPGFFSRMIPQNLKDIECDLCKDFVEQLQQQLKDPSVKKSLQNLLEKGCAMLPGQLASECKNYVDQNIDNLINILVQDMDPSLVCVALNLCQESKTVNQEKPDDTECEFCKIIVQKLDDDLNDQRTEEEIKEALLRICSYFPSSYCQKCEIFVSTYSAMLLSLLSKGLNPKLVCNVLKLCPDLPTQPKPIVPKVKSIECVLCKEIVGKLDDELKDKRTKEEIERALATVCSYLPSSYTEECTNFINTYSDLLISLLASELNPTMVCGALKICPVKLEALLEWQSKVKDLECEGCQYLLHYIQNELMDASTQEQLKSVIKRVCKVFPKVYDQNCEAYIDEFGGALLAIIAQEIDPSIVCFDLNVCTQQNATLFKQQHIEQVKPLKLDECTLCTTVVDYLSTLLEEDDVDKEIAVLVEKVCTVIPSSLKVQCTTLIETYGPYILQMIGQLSDSQQVCQAIDMCTRTRGHVHLLGGKKCTFGPSYWCQSKIHASACKAEMYCKQKVWEN